MGNKIRTTILLAAMTALIIWIGQLFGGKQGMIIAFLIAAGMNFFSYWYSDKIVLKMYRAKEVSPQQAPEVYEMVQTLTRNAGLPMPKLCVIPKEALLRTRLVPGVRPLSLERIQNTRIHGLVAQQKLRIGRQGPRFHKAGQRHAPSALAREHPIGPRLHHGIEPVAARGRRPFDVVDLRQCPLTDRLPAASPVLGTRNRWQPGTRRARPRRSAPAASRPGTRRW